MTTAPLGRSYTVSSDTQTTTMKTTTITWHPYPQEKPSETGYYITTEIQGKCKIVSFAYWRGTEWSFNPPKLIAWAEFPKAYEEANT